VASSTKLSAGSAVGFGALVLTGSLVIVALVTMMFGAVGGSEFNPETFDRRSFGFYEIPLIRLQVLPLWRSPATGDVERLIHSQSYITPNSSAPETWHLVQLRRSFATPPETDVMILARYLDAQDEHHNAYWAEWSNKHPQMAALLWPEIARLARLELYTLMPPLFELAENATSAATLQQDLRALQVKRLDETAARWQKNLPSIKDEPRQSEVSARIESISKAAREASEALSQPLPEVKPKKPDEKPAAEGSTSPEVAEP
jgi:hypothetical protein